MKRPVTGCIITVVAFASASPAWADGKPNTYSMLKHELVTPASGFDTKSVSPKPATCIEYDLADTRGGAQDVKMFKTMISDQYSMAEALDISADVQVKSINTEVNAQTSYVQKTNIEGSSLSLAEFVKIEQGMVAVDQKKSNVELPSLAAQMSKQAPAASLEDRLKLQARAGNDPHQAGQALQASLNLHRSQAPTMKARSAATASTMAGAAKSIRLTDEAAALSRSNPTEFRRICGDGYVASISYGGTLAFTYTFLTQSKSEQTNIAGKLNVSYGSPTVSASGSLAMSDEVKKASDQKRLAITYMSSGGSGTPIPTTFEQVDGVVSGFAAAVKEAPAAYEFTVVPYSNLPNFEGAGTMAGTDRFMNVAWEYSKARNLKDTADRIIADYNDRVNGTGRTDNKYLWARWGFGINELQKVQAAAGGRLTQLKTTAEACLASNATTCSVDPFDDNQWRVFFPLPYDDGNMGAMAVAIWGDSSKYAAQVVDYWIKQPNNMYCGLSSDFCKLDQELSVYERRVVSRPAVAALKVRGTDRCLIGKMDGLVVTDSCPTNANQKERFFSYDTAKAQLSTQAAKGGCLSVNRMNLPGKTMTQAKFGTCNQTAGANTWTIFSTDDKGGLYFSSNAPEYSGQCLDYSGGLPGVSSRCDGALVFTFHRVEPLSKN